MTIKDVRASLIKDLEEEYTNEQVSFIDKRLEEIAKENSLSNEDLDYYCTANSSEMFSVIFDYKEFDEDNFEID
jgi:hypothetical protein